MKVATATGSMSYYFKDQFDNLFIIGQEKNIPKDLDLLILTGGEDINPTCYGEINNMSYGVNTIRDDIEFNILRKVLLETNAKVLGVCRGLQLINIFFGGSLYQDLETYKLRHDYIHGLMWNSVGHPLYWLDIVNSMHHQAIKNIAHSHGIGGKVVAREPITSIPEAVIWYNKLFGVQFHPEFFGDNKKRFFYIIKDWVCNNISLQ